MEIVIRGHERGRIMRIANTWFEANACLIATTPELLSELKDALNEICRLCVRLNPQHEGCQSCEDMAKRRQVIAKAEGEENV